MFHRLVSKSWPKMTSKEGGWFGWLIVFIGFVYNLVSNGIPLAFGIMIPNIVKDSNCTTPQLVTVGAVAFGLNYLPAVLICALTTLIGCRKVAIFGGFVCAIACAVSGLVTNCNHLMLTYGLLGGTSFALFNLPGEMMVNMHFHKRRAIAHSIIVCGTPIGILILPLVITAILNATNVQSVFFTISGIAGICALLGFLLVAPPLLDPERPTNEDNNADDKNVSNLCSFVKNLCQTIIDKEVTLNGRFILFIAARATCRWAMVMIMMIMPTYLESRGLSTSTDLTGPS